MTKTLSQPKNKYTTKSNFINFIANIKDKTKIKQKSEENSIVKMLKEAHSEWINAERYFQNAIDPELIDYAIFNVEAARTKFCYLLKQAREKGINIEI